MKINQEIIQLVHITEKLKQIWVPIMVFSGVVLNLLTIMVFCRRKMRKYCVSLSMICLAISDTSVLTISVFFTWLDEVFYNNYFVNNTVWCNLHGYADLISCSNSSWIIILISVERWFAVCKPWEKQKKFTNKRVAWTLVFLFLLSALLYSYFPISLRVGIEQNLTIQTNQSSCHIYLKKTYKYFGMASVLLIYVIPFFVLAFLNFMIIVKLRLRPFTNSSINLKKTKEKNTNNTMTEISITHTTEITYTNQYGNQIQFNYSKNDRNLSITLVTVAFTFMILTFPFQVLWFYENIYLQLKSNFNENELANFQINNYLNELTFFIKNMNYLINFFLYSALSKLFRHEFLALWSDYKQIILNLFQTKNELEQDSDNKRNNSSLAELSFSMEAFKQLKNGNLKNPNQKLFQIKIEPSYFKEYFRKKNSNLSSPKTKTKLNREIENSPTKEINLNENLSDVNHSNVSFNSKNKNLKTCSTQTIRTTIKQYKIQSNSCKKF